MNPEVLRELIKKWRHKPAGPQPEPSEHEAPIIRAENAAKEACAKELEALLDLLTP